MGLLDFFSSGIQQNTGQGMYTNSQVDAAGMLSSVQGKMDESLLQLVNLKPGQVFKGQITDIRQDGVTIATGNTTIKARFQEPVDLHIQEEFHFQVKGNENGTITIAPVKEFANTEDAILYKALEKANMAATDKNLDIVEALMKHGMPVEKEQIQKFAALSIKYPQAAPEQLVLLASNGIEITDSQIARFSEYQNWQNKTTKQLGELAEQLPKLFSQISNENGTDTLKAWMEQLTALEQKAGSEMKHPVLKEFVELLQKPNVSSEEAAQFLASNKDAVSEAFLELWSVKPENVGGEEVNQFYRKLSQELSLFKEMLASVDGEENVAMAKHPNTAIGNETTSFLGNLISEVEQQLTFMGQMNQSGSRNGGGQKHLMAFLPLKMQKEITQGDLYVYTRKNGGWNLKEGVSLFLHLDMTHLGPLDVSMEMKARSVRMSFFTDTKESYDILREHLPKLDERLKERGYQLSGVVKEKEEKADFVKDFVKVGEEKRVIKRYSFDMRV